MFQLIFVSIALMLCGLTHKMSTFREHNCVKTTKCDLKSINKQFATVFTVDVWCTFECMCVYLHIEHIVHQFSPLLSFQIKMTTTYNNMSFHLIFSKMLIESKVFFVLFDRLNDEFHNNKKHGNVPCIFFCLAHPSYNKC